MTPLTRGYDSPTDPRLQPPDEPWEDETVPEEDPDAEYERRRDEVLAGDRWRV